MVTFRNMSLKVAKESVVRRTEYEEERTKKQLVMEEEVRFMDEGHRYSLFLMMLDNLVKQDISGCSIEMAVSILMKELAKAGSDLEDELPFH